MNSTRDIFKSLLAIFFGLLIALLLLEAIFRILPTSDSLKAQEVNKENAYMHFAPNRIVNLSDGIFFDIRVQKRINNYGYLSDIDFNRNHEKKKIIVIGDSYVEATQVANRQSIHGVLNSLLQPRTEVYGIGASGSALSQYLAYAKFAVTEFQPDALVFVIISNDFDESITNFKNAPGFHYFSIKEDGYEHLLIDYFPSTLTEVLRKSAFVRYLYLNAGIQNVSMKKLFGKQDDSEFVGNVQAQVSPQRLNLSMKAVDIFLGELKELTKASPIPIVFVVDGIRQEIYEKRNTSITAASYVSEMFKYFSSQAEKANFEVIDMHPIFQRHYLIHKERFEFPTNFHWNSLGHNLAANAVLRSKAVLYSNINDAGLMKN